MNLDENAVESVHRPAKSVAFVLAGGESRRMGRDKLTLSRVREASSGDVSSLTILSHVVQVAASVADVVWVLTAPLGSGGDTSMRGLAARFPGRVVVHTDKEFYRGPLIALAQAWPLATEGGSITEVYVMAGDLPGVCEEVLRVCKAKLLDTDTEDRPDAVLVERDNVFQPLLGCYRPEVGLSFSRAVHDGETRLMRVVRTLCAHGVPVEEQNWPLWWTRPVHTPEDYREWLNLEQR